MKTNKRPQLKITLPTQKQGEHLVAETRPEYIARYLKNLPYGNMAKTLPSILNSLSSFNRTEVSDANRLNALALYDNSYQLISEYYRSRTFHRDKRRAKITIEEKLAFYKLTQEMAYGYKLLAMAMEQKKGPGQVQANILNLTLYYLSLVLMAHYGVYAPAPSNIWREIHSILHYAIYYDLIDSQLPKSAPAGCLGTIEKTYLRITLIALVNPYHLNQGQHWPIWNYLTHWVECVELSDDMNDFSAGFTFVADLESDDRPRQQDDISHLDESNTLLILLQDLCLSIKNQLSKLHAEGKPPLPGFGSEVNASKAKMLLEIMYQHWRGQKKRELPRAKNPQKLSILVGFKNIHHALCQQDMLTSTLEPKASKGTESFWYQINSSTGGLCINTGALVKDISIGQLLAIQNGSSASEQGQYRLAVVRWLQSNKQKGITIGIEWIAGEIQPITINILGLTQRKELGFIVSGEDVLGQSKPTLLFPHESIPQNQIVILEIGDEELAIAVQQIIIETFYFERVFYQMCSLSEAKDMIEIKKQVAIEARKREESGEEEIEMTALPGFGQKIELNENPLERPESKFASIKKGS